MALQSTTWSAGSSTWTDTYKGFVLTLELTQNSISKSNNTSNISYILTLSNPNRQYPFWYNGSATVTLTLGGQDLSRSVYGWYFGRDSSGNTTSTWSQELISGSIDVSHNSDGTLNLPLYVYLPTVYGSIPSMSISDSWTLQSIPKYKLTINYYSNNATSCTFDGAETVAEGRNVLVASEERPYNQGTDTLWNYSSLGLTRTGYANRTYWNTEPDGSGISVGQDDPYTGGEAWANAFGTSILDGDVTVNIYAQWSPYKLTVNYYGNGATSGTLDRRELTNPSGLVCTEDYYYSNTSTDLDNIQNPDHLYLIRSGYQPTGNWMTSLNGGYVVNQNTIHSAASLANALGKDISNSDQIVDVYAQWYESALFNFNGESVNGLVFNNQVVTSLVYNGVKIF